MDHDSKYKNNFKVLIPLELIESNELSPSSRLVIFHRKARQNIKKYKNTTPKSYLLKLLGKDGKDATNRIYKKVMQELIDNGYVYSKYSQYYFYEIDENFKSSGTKRTSNDKFSGTKRTSVSGTKRTSINNKHPNNKTNNKEQSFTAQVFLEKIRAYSQSQTIDLRSLEKFISDFGIEPVEKTVQCVVNSFVEKREIDKISGWMYRCLSERWYLNASKSNTEARRDDFIENVEICSIDHKKEAENALNSIGILPPDPFENDEHDYTIYYLKIMDKKKELIHGCKICRRLYAQS